MIYGTLAASAHYAGLHHGIQKVLEAAKQYTPNDPFGERIALDGDRIYLNLAEYDTHDKVEGIAEAHRQYIDVMVMVQGEETVYVKPTAGLQHIAQVYDAHMDALLAQIDDDCRAIRLQAGDFLVLYPEDAHAPGCHPGRMTHVKKIIGKVKIAE